MRIAAFGTVAVCTIAVVILTASWAVSQQAAKPATPEQIKHGAYLATLSGCHDCHSPKIFTEKGPIPDTTRLLSGTPSAMKVPEIPKGAIAPDQWGALTSNDFTTWAGPWGVSFTANLTPDNLTGTGAWNEAVFIKAIRTGKHMGTGRDILPPMPWPYLAQAHDSDLKDIFAYMHSLKPIENPVPLPIPPAAPPAGR